MNNKDHLIKPKIAPKTLLNNPRLTTLINFVKDFANRVTKLQVIKKVIKKTNIFNKLKLILKELYKKFEIKSSKFIAIENPRKIANKLDISTIKPLEKPLNDP